MNQNATYSNLILQNMSRYGWQSFGTKIVTAVLAATFLLMGQAPSSLTSLVPSFAVILCMILWLLDGHYSALKEEYVQMFQDLAKSGEKPVQMPVAKANKLNVAALWNPMVVVFYLPAICMLLILALR